MARAYRLVSSGALALALMCCGAAAIGGGVGKAERARARQVLDLAGVHGGLVVHLGCGDGRLTAALRAGPGYLVQGLDRDAAAVAKARHYFHSLGILGPVSASQFDGTHLPYADNLVNLLVVSEPYQVSREEMLRVLAPRGVACIARGGGWRKIAKPWPKEIDEWTHYLHGPDNNAVARDTVVGPPRHMQWLAEPLWTRNHHRLNSISSVVTAGGRLFYIVDLATAANVAVPGKWTLVARDAFSGVRLWQKPLRSWAWHGLRFRSGPPQVTRLLVATADRVYAPLGLGEPVSAIDAITGRTVATYKATAGAEEMILTGETLLVLRSSPVPDQARGHPAFKAEFSRPRRKAVVAIRVGTGRKSWEWSPPQGLAIRPETLASDGSRAYVQVSDSVACLDLRSGRLLWLSPKPASQPQKAAPRKKKRRYIPGFGRYTVVVADGVVLAKLGTQLVALSADSGKKLWECRGGAGFHSPPDIFVINGLVWQGDHPKDSVAPPPYGDFSTARDLRTGKVVSTNSILVDLQTAGHHHRCYREKATIRYIITGKRGVELMDLADDNHSRNNWVRGTCQYGIMPANGLIYVPPHSCGCYMESLLKGFWALAATQPAIGSRLVRPQDRLQRGPAYGNVRPTPTNPQDWPQFRHDAVRSGVATTTLPPRLKQAWRTTLGGKLSQPVAAGGRVLVAAVDEGSVCALDATSGKLLWRYTAGSRVDSPPAVYRGLVLFGSADGWVYCLRLADGALVWRFLAAPADLRTVARDRVESLWPVHGSVLVLKGVAYFSAGRSTWLDGGIVLYGLDPATGKVLYRNRFASRHPRLGEGKDKDKPEYRTRVAQNTTDYKTFLQPDRSDSFSMAGGAVSDVLVSDGTNVFLHHVRFGPDLKRHDVMTRHLFSTSSLLDGAENHRSHWVLGTGDFSRVPVAYSWVANRPGRWNPGMAVPVGLTMVFTDKALWAARRKGDANGKYYLLKRANKPFSPDEKPLPDFRRLPKGSGAKNLWQRDLPVRPRAMLKAGERLYLGVMPVEIPPDDPHAAYEGRRGGALWVVSAKDGATIAQHKMASPVTWDGMAAAGGRLFTTTMAGEVVCWSGAR